MRRLFAIGLMIVSSIVSTRMIAGPACSGNHLLEKTFNSGAKWQMCWEHRQREGILLHDIFYTPPQGTERRIFNQANIAQIHVPYDDNGARYHDVSDYGLGGDYMNDIQSADCPGGARRGENGKNLICTLTRERNHAHAHHSGSTDEHKMGQYFEVFSVTHVGAYNYMPTWRFNDDGSMEIAMGATGSLQRYRTGSNYQSSGWLLDSSNRYGVSHLHNYYWRLDFDLGVDANDDMVEQIEFVSQSGNASRKKLITRFSTEVARSIAPKRYRSWRIRDGAHTNANGHAISYEIEPLLTGHRDEGPSYEPWTKNDFYVTVNKSCEKYASHNPTINNCADNLAEFVNGHSLNGKDLVIWYGMTFHHIPRDEDEPKMHAHWNSFKIVPRNVTSKNPLADGSIPANSPPVLTMPADQNDMAGGSVSLTLAATDNDADGLTFSATNLPDGLLISNDGVISGTLTTAGIFQVSIVVNDGLATDQGTFKWTVQSTSSGSCQIYASTNIPVAISSSGTPLIKSVLNIANSGTITDVNVLNLKGSHTYISDLDFTLSSPAGTAVKIIASSCGSADNFNLALDDQAASANWPCPPIDGARYKPSNSIAIFIGQQSSGQWELSIQDGTNQDGGSLDSWSLEICMDSNTVNQPPVITNPGNQGGMVGDSISFTVSASDPDNDPLTYTAVGLPSGMQIQTTTGVISGTLDQNSAGPYSVSVTVSDGQHSDSVGFGWLVEMPTTVNPECGEPVIDSAADQALFLWKDCGTGQWHMRAPGGGSTTGLQHSGSINSPNGFDTYTAYSLESSDSLTLSANGQQLDYTMKIWLSGEDGLDFVPGANACFDATRSTTPVLLGTNRQPVTMAINLDTLGSCQTTPPPVDACGEPVIDSAADQALFLWKDCGTGQWHMRAPGGGSTTGLQHSGSINSPNGFD
ncbi:MAG: putative Ig domain-containing protein, partial [Gammaproteobacteria bacterium]